MADAKQLTERLERGEVVVLDGAIGTELERLGAPMHDSVWCARALVDHPDLVRSVHRSYIEAGADVITTNSYASPRHALEPAGLGDRMVEWNALSVAFARQAREACESERRVYIAGSVSTFGNFGRLTGKQLAANFREQAQILIDHGVDLLLLETLGATSEVIEAAVESTADLGLPVWVTMSCLESCDTDTLMLGVEESQAHSDFRHELEPLQAAIESVMAAGGSALLMMHSDLKVTRSVVELMHAHYRGPCGAYPNAGYWLRPQWAFVDEISPEDYAREAMGWVEAGATIVGGCCGIGPDHIRAVREAVS